MWITYVQPSVGTAAEIQETFFLEDEARDDLAGESDSIAVLPFFVMRTADRTLLPGWLASQTDMLADDWELVD